MEAPVVNVGIMTEKAVSFVFHGEYVHTETGTSYSTGSCLKRYSLNRPPLPRLSN